MKPRRFFMLIVLALASCAAPLTETPVPTQTFTLEPTFPSPTNTVGAPTMTVTPDPVLGSIEGNLSWLLASTSTNVPIKGVNLEINGHTGSNPRYTIRTDENGYFKFSNIEPGEYGFGIYLNLQISERRCETPEYVYSQDLQWLHYATGLKIDVWYDILFSSVDVIVNPGEVAVLDFELRCP